MEFVLSITMVLCRCLCLEEFQHDDDGDQHTVFWDEGAEVDIVGKYVERMMQGYKIKAFAQTVEGSLIIGEGGSEEVEVSKVGDYGSLQ